MRKSGLAFVGVFLFISMVPASAQNVERYRNGRINCERGHNAGLAICNTCRTLIATRNLRTEAARRQLWRRCLDRKGHL